MHCHSMFCMQWIMGVLLERVRCTYCACSVSHSSMCTHMHIEEWRIDWSGNHSTRAIGKIRTFQHQRSLSAEGTEITPPEAFWSMWLMAVWLLDHSILISCSWCSKEICSIVYTLHLSALPSPPPQVCNMHDGVCPRGGCAVPALHALLPHPVRRWLAHARPNLPDMHGTGWPCHLGPPRNVHAAHG